MAVHGRFEVALGERGFDHASSEPGAVRVVVLGSGFGGLAFLKSFVKNAPRRVLDSVELLLVTKRNHHVFTPLIYQVASGLVDEHHVLDPLPTIRVGGFRVVAEVVSIDLKGKRVVTNRGEIPYDYLVVALGSVSNDFGIPGVREHAIPLKTVQDGESMRNRIIASFEEALLLGSGDDRLDPLLTFVVVGGGATGVELAGTLRDYVRMLAEKYGLSNGPPKVVLLEAATSLLPGASSRLSAMCLEDLRSAGVDVRLGAKVVEVTGEGCASQTALSSGA